MKLIEHRSIQLNKWTETYWGGETSEEKNVEYIGHWMHIQVALIKKIYIYIYK